MRAPFERRDKAVNFSRFSNLAVRFVSVNCEPIQIYNEWQITLFWSPPLKKQPVRGMTMKKNLLPEMQQITMSDQSGEQISLSVEVRRGENGLYVFLSDAHQLGASRLAQNAVFFFEKICHRLNLKQEETTFYRHIFQDQMGSLFGRYSVDWASKEGPSYKFQMLTNIDDLHNVKSLLDSTAKLELAELMAAPKVG